MRIIAILSACLALSGTLLATEWSPPKTTAQTICPISGRHVNGSSFADVDGFRIYTAGPAEAEKVRENPAKAFTTLYRNREAAVPVAWVCPSTGREVGPDALFVQQAGKRIYYCCKPCYLSIANNFKAAAAEIATIAEQNIPPRSVCQRRPGSDGGC